MVVVKHFRDLYHFTTQWPMPVSEILLFISYCVEQGYSSSTIRTYIAGISFIHKVSGGPDTSAHFVVKKILEGCRRSRQRVDDRRPITRSILGRMCEVLHVVCYNDYEMKLFKAAFCITYFGLLRVSEVVFTTPTMSDRPLLVGDINMEDAPANIVVCIRLSKTGKAGDPAYLKIPADTETAICPVHAIQTFLAVRPDRDCVTLMVAHSLKDNLRGC